jgi:transposase
MVACEWRLPPELAGLAVGSGEEFAMTTSLHPHHLPQRFYLGIDIAKAKFDVALLEGATLLDTGEFTNNPAGFRRLSTWLNKHCKASHDDSLHACMEATGKYGNDLAAFLHALFANTKHRVSVVNPHLTSAYARSRLQRNKTDKLDAENIAHYCAAHSPDAWQPPTEEQERLKELTRHQESVEKNLTQEKLRLKSGIKSPVVQRQIKRHIRFLEEQLKDINDEIASLCTQSEELNSDTQLLVTIPGVGLATAAKFLAEVPPLHLFHSAAQLVAYAGLSPEHRQSGSSVYRRGKLSKKGNQHLRTAVYMPTLAAMRCNPIVKALTDRLKTKGKHNMTAVAAGMRKLLQLMYGVLKSGRPFDPNYAAAAT